MRNNVAITVSSNPRYLGIIRDVTTRVGQMQGLDEEMLERIRLAVDEACSNVIKHAYKGDITKEIVIKYKMLKRSFRVTIEDKGMKVQPELLKGRDLNDVRPGGLGLHLINRAFDIVRFDEKRKRGNRLILIKYL